MENTLLIGDFLIETLIHRDFFLAMFDYQRIYPDVFPLYRKLFSEITASCRAVLQVLATDVDSHGQVLLQRLWQVDGNSFGTSTLTKWSNSSCTILKSIVL